jgi:hypothetical protein
MVSENVLDRAAGVDLSNNHSDCDASTTDAGPAAHHSRLQRDAIQICHRARSLLFNAQNIPERGFEPAAYNSNSTSDFSYTLLTRSPSHT